MLPLLEGEATSIREWAMRDGGHAVIAKRMDALTSALWDLLDGPDTADLSPGVDDDPGHAPDAALGEVTSEHRRARAAVDEVVRPDVLGEVYGTELLMVDHPHSGTPMIVPRLPETGTP